MIKNYILVDFEATCCDDDSFPREEMEIIESWCAKFESPTFASWGFYDKKQIKKDCALHGIPCNTFHPHVNIKETFAKVQKYKRGMGMAKAMKLAKVELTGTHHRGIDDVKNMVKLLPFIFGNEKIIK